MELNIKRIKESDYQKIFVLTDIHGRFDLFKKMIRKIKLKKKDLLLILGDSCDEITIDSNGEKIIIKKK